MLYIFGYDVRFKTKSRKSNSNNICHSLDFICLKSDQPIIPIKVLQLVLQYLNYYHRTLSAVQDHAMYQLIYQLIDI